MRSRVGSGRSVTVVFILPFSKVYVIVFIYLDYCTGTKPSRAPTGHYDRLPGDLAVLYSGGTGDAVTGKEGVHAIDTPLARAKTLKQGTQYAPCLRPLTFPATASHTSLAAQKDK